MPRQFPPEFRQRALRMLEESMPEHETEYLAIRHVGAKLGVGPETLRRWRRRAEIDAGVRLGVTSEENSELKRLKRENAELRRANEILRTASAFFAAELDRPRRDDPIRGQVQGAFRRSRPSAARCVLRNAGLSLPRLSGRENQAAIGEGTVGSAAGRRNAAPAHRELRRPYGSEDACPDAPPGGRSVGIRPAEPCALSGFVESIAANACSRQSPILPM